MSVKFTIPADAKQETAGSLSSLTTTEKGSLVGAVNEVNGKLTKSMSIDLVSNAAGYAKATTSAIIPVSFIPNSNSYDGIYTVFVSKANNQAYIRVEDIDGTIKPSVSIVGTLWYFDH